MVRFSTLGLCGFFLSAQYAFAAPEQLEPRAISRITTVYTTTKTFTGGANGRRTRTVTRTLPTIIRTTVKNTPSPSPVDGNCASIGSGNYVDNHGVFYTVSCGTDYYGGDVARVEGSSFLSCFDHCDSHPECVAFSWVGQGAEHVGPGDCYLKSTLRGGEARENVDGAYVDKTK